MQPFPSSRPEKLLVRAVNWLGDAVLTTPALGALRAACPQARITIAAKPLVAELFRYHPHIDGIEVYDKEGAHAGAIGMFRKARELRRGGYEAAVLLQNAIDAALLTFLRHTGKDGVCDRREAAAPFAACPGDGGDPVPASRGILPAAPRGARGSPPGSPPAFAACDRGGTGVD